ncbi:DUF2927 domain-containing protein [Albimonas sp. CAU 1670]|uniref:DUF2927 domain-containing protein n=1 Tax=Albimonas sp. CAU 1670 TaxID=3032599 RepID=UPI0023DCDAAC|nr:DUF2927 domain-containing protein [Albimonas sp. CAU 1670]MDF2232797.1 DUF2927 domain-containing protein [Albimonas sp. CAU 1670]
MRPASRFPRSLRAARVLPALAALALASGCVQNTDELYAQALERYAAAGLMRTETAPADAPFTNADLARDFERIAFHMEFEESEDLIQNSTPVTLVKWDGPIRWKLMGDGARAEDFASYRGYIARLSRLTGLEFIETEGEPDILLVIATPAMRAAILKEIDAAKDSTRQPLMREWARNDLYPCVGQVTRARKGGKWRNSAKIVIKSETRGVLRESCIHEELAQTLGLLNDDGEARPSIFNDDQEFALLTVHDELLLRILYDPRLKAGMTAEQGMPIVRRIIDEIGPGPRLDGRAAPPPPVPAGDMEG